MYRKLLHEKRARFNEEARSRDALFIRRNRSSVHNGDGIIHKGDRNLTWMLVQHTEVETVENSDDSVASHGLKLVEGQSTEGVKNSTEAKNTDGVGSGLVQKTDAGIQDNNSGNKLDASSGTSYESEFGNMHTDPVMRASSSRTSMNLSPMVFKSGSRTSTHHGSPSSRGGQNIGSGDVFDQ